MSSTNSSTHLKHEGSAADLALRGFGPAEILDRTEVDIGANGEKIRSETKGIDRPSYSAAHVRSRLGQERIDEAVRQYEDGVPHTELLSLLGLGDGSNRAASQLRSVFRALGIAPKRKKYAPTVSFTGLFEKGSAFDLACRGYNQAAIREATGTDLGGPRSHARDNIRGIDPLEYSAAHVRERIEPSRLDEVFANLAKNRVAKNEVFAALGLGFPYTTMESLFTGIGLADRFHKAHRKRRQEWVKDVASKAHTPEANAKRISTARARAADPDLRAHDVAKREATMLTNHNVRNPLQLPEVKERIRVTNKKRFGHDHHNQRLERREAMREVLVNGRIETMQAAKDYSPEARARYGAQMRTWWAVPENKERALDKKRENGTWKSSNPERDLHAVLANFFGTDDVEAQYRKDERYPWACDFYIKSRDLFIELNGTWTHHDHWFDPNNPGDLAVIEKWRAKATPFYLAAIKNWTERDVAKRNAARKHRLNYAVFWGTEAVEDARAWIAAGAPDRSDWQ
jgi:hypothetical protein